MPEHVFIIGAMKAATTTLHHLLAKDEAFVDGNQKELNYFFKEKSPYFYPKVFPKSAEAKFTLESSTNYTKPHQWFGMDEETIPQRILALGSGVKLIYLVRDPMVRLESHLRHDFYRHGRIVDRCQIWRAASVSRYAEQVDRYLRNFDRSQLFIGSSEALCEDQASFLSALGRFLGHDISLSRHPLQLNRGRPAVPFPELQKHKSFVAQALLPVTYRLAFEYGIDKAHGYATNLERHLKFSGDANSSG